MSRMNVSDFKACTVAGQTARSQSGQTALVGNFRQRVVLIHKLRQLGRTEKFADNRSNRFCVNQILRLNVVQILRAHSFANGSFHPEQSHTILVFHQFADGTYTTVAEVVNIINFTLAVTQFAKSFNDSQNIVLAQDTICVGSIVKGNVKGNVHFNAADGRQIVTVIVKEQTVKQLIGGFICGRITRAHNAVNIQQSFFAAAVFVAGQSVADIRTDVYTVNKQGFNLADFILCKSVQKFLIDFIAGFCQYLSGLGNDNVGGQEFAQHLFRSDLVIFQTVVSQFLSQTRRQLFACFQNHIAGFGINQIKVKLNALHTFRNEFDFPVFLIGNICVGIIEVI